MEEQQTQQTRQARNQSLIEGMFQEMVENNGDVDKPHLGDTYDLSDAEMDWLDSVEPKILDVYNESIFKLKGLNPIKVSRSVIYEIIIGNQYTIEWDNDIYVDDHDIFLDGTFYLDGEEFNVTLPMTPAPFSNYKALNQESFIEFAWIEGELLFCPIEWVKDIEDKNNWYNTDFGANGILGQIGPDKIKFTMEV